jgi:hypothetical protein
VAFTSFAAAPAARRAAFGAEVLHRGISMGDPLSKVASDLENSKRSCVRNFLHPFRQRSCNWTLTRITSAARLGWRVLCLMSLRCSHASHDTSKAFWMREMAQRRHAFFFWSDVDVLLLGVGPFLSDASQWQLMPANAALFAHGTLGAPLVVSCEAGQGVIARVSSIA